MTIVILRNGAKTGGRWMVALRSDGVEIYGEVCGKVSGEGFAIKLLGEFGGELLSHGERDKQRIARCPGNGPVVEEMKFDGERIAARSDEGVDAASVCLQLVELIGRQRCEGAVGSGANLQVALQPIMLNERWAEDFGKLAGGVAAESVHLEEAVLRGDVALREEQVVEIGGGDGGHALRVTRDSDGSRETGDGDIAFDLGERGVHGVAQPDGHDKQQDERDKEERCEREEDAPQNAAGFADSDGRGSGSHTLADKIMRCEREIP
jgi:hypothetical protein